MPTRAAARGGTPAPPTRQPPFAPPLPPHCSNREELTPARLRGYACVIFAAPQEAFSNSEIAALHHYVESGGSLLLLSGEGGDGKSGSNLNALLEP
jgi:hypothetical protein